MLKHIVWWELKDEADGYTAKENAERIKNICEKFKDKINGLINIEVSYDIKETSTVKAQIVLQTEHNTVEDLSLYANHHEHLKLVDVIKKVTSSRNCIDYII